MIVSVGTWCLSFIRFLLWCVDGSTWTSTYKLFNEISMTGHDTFSTGLHRMGGTELFSTFPY